MFQEEVKSNAQQTRVGALRRMYDSLRHIGPMRADPLGYFTGMMLKNPVKKPYALGFDSVIMMNDPAGIKHVMVENSQNYPKSQFYKPLQALMGAGIIISEGPEWLAQRRAAAPQFTGASLESMVDNIVETTNQLLDDWERRMRNDQLTIMAGVEMMHIAFSAAAKALFSLTLSADQRLEVYAAFTSFLRAAEHRTWSLLKLPLFIDEKINPLYRRAIPSLTKIADELIADCL